MAVTVWPILEPSQDERLARREGKPEHAAPLWVRITSGRAIDACDQAGSDPSPEVLAAQEASRMARAAARQIREREAEELRAAAQAKVAEERRLRVELSARNKAEAANRRQEDAERRRAARKTAKAPKASKVYLTREERAQRITEGMARARADGKGVGGRKQIKPPEGYTSIAEAASACGYNRVYLARKCELGEVPSIKQGGLRFVRIGDVMAYKAEAALRLAEARVLNAATAREARAARAAQTARPWARLCPRKRGAA